MNKRKYSEIRKTTGLSFFAMIAKYMNTRAGVILLIVPALLPSVSSSDLEEFQILRFFDISLTEKYHSS